MSALFNSLIRALAGVAFSVAVVALVWTIYINRDSVSDIAAPVVTPLVDSMSSTAPSTDGANQTSPAGEEPAK